MNVIDIMTRSPKTIRHDATLREALELMEEVGCRHLPVLSREKHLVGIISDRDCRLALNSPHIMRERWQDEAIINQTRVASIMSPAPIIVESDVPAAEAARLMLIHRISALPVMRGETLIGIVTTSDILAAFMTLEKKLAALPGYQPSDGNNHVML
ncbi:MAG: hypothetical protein Kow00117_23110 [Phototrophicales bacterium]